MPCLALLRLTLPAAACCRRAELNALGAASSSNSLHVTCVCLRPFASWIHRDLGLLRRVAFLQSAERFLSVRFDIT